jgi:hypothetical protein
VITSKPVVGVAHGAAARRSGAGNTWADPRNSLRRRRWRPGGDGRRVLPLPNSRAATTSARARFQGSELNAVRGVDGTVNRRSSHHACIAGHKSFSARSLSVAQNFVLLVVGVAGAAWSFAQGYSSLQRVADLQNKIGSVECVQTQISRRHFTPEQRSRLVSKLALAPNTVANVWVFSGGRVEKTEFSVTLVDVFREAKWKTNGVTTRMTPVPYPFRHVAVRESAGSNTIIDSALNALVGELNLDCITAFAMPPFTDNGDFGTTRGVDKSGSHLDTSQANIFGPPPLQNPNISMMIGDAF